jgi:hypothetical protein
MKARAEVVEATNAKVGGRREESSRSVFVDYDCRL